MSEPVPLEPGARVDGRYLLRRRLGAGGFGAVWLATDEGAAGLTREVALKILHPRLHAHGGVVRARFEREAEVLARLDHPSVVKPLAFSVGGEHAYLAMEYVDGLPLDRVIKECARREEPLDVKETARIFDELAAAIHYVHGEGVVHRDLKPANVMLVRRGGRAFVKVLDLGIARILAPDGRDATTVGRMIGSLYYCAPEQLRGEPVDARCDVFALGAILFELTTAHRAFVRHDGRPVPAHQRAGRGPENAPPAVLARITEGPRPKPSDVREGLPLGLDAVVARALAIDPAARFPSALALAEAAAPLLADLEVVGGTRLFQLPAQLEPAEDDLVPVSEPDPSPPTRTEPEPLSVERPFTDPRPTPAGRRAPLPGLLGAGLLLLGCAAAVVFFAARKSSSPGVAGPSPVLTASVAAPRPTAGHPSPAATPAPSVTEAPSEAAAGGPQPAPAAVPSARAVADPRPAAAQGPVPPGGAVPSAVRPAQEAPRAPAPSRAATKARGGSPVTASPPAPTALDRLVQRAREAPDDLPRLAALGDAVRQAAAQLPQGALRTRLERRVATSTMDGDVEGLARCAREVQEALRGQLTGP
jgi:serine/threonine protein kinase